MSYIGNAPISAAFLTDTFSGTGSQVAYTMTVAPANTSSIIVAVTGVLQDPSTYSVSGTTLTFSAAPPSGTSNISVRYLGIPASGVTTTAYRTVTDFTATASQTSFSVPSYTVGYIDVYRNGVRLVSTDYTATTGTTVVLTNACTVGDSVVTESFLVSSVLNAIPNTGGSVSASNLASSGTPSSSNFLRGDMAWSTLSRSNMPVGAVLQVVSTTKSDTFSSSAASFTDITGLSVSITPTSATSKVLITAQVTSSNGSGAGATYISFRLVRGSTAIGIGDAAGSRLQATSQIQTPDSGTAQSGILHFQDSPATTSATTYKIQVYNQNTGVTTFINRSSTDSDSAVYARSTSTITVMEIAA